MKFAILPLLLLAVITATSCSNYAVIQEQKRQKELISAAVVKASQQEFTIHVYPVQCTSKNPEVFYISKALAEIIANFLKPMMSEVIIKPYDYPTNQEILDMIINTNSVFFKDYVTNMLTVSTQFVYEIVTNEDVIAIVVTNTEEKTVQKKKIKAYSYVYSTNTNVTIQTNISVSSVLSTNLNILTMEKYRELMDKEFPELTNSLTRVPIIVVKDLSSTDETTNIVTEPETNSAHIFGSFAAFRTKNGPNEIQLNLTVVKNIDKLSTLKLNLTAREDQVSDKIYDLLKPIRKFFLDRPTGDVVLVTDPEDANIYMDGTYIGKSPLFYPAVTAENHEFTYLKPGFTQSSLRAEVLEEKTNIIYKTITKLKTGGAVEINSSPTNANVFIESGYVGNTPLTVSNLTLGIDHRVKILNTDTNMDLPAYYHTFRINNDFDQYRINANLVPNYALKSILKETLWWATIGGWGVTIGLLGMNIYTHYQSEYYLDYYKVNGDTTSQMKYQSYKDLNTTLFTSFVIGTMVTLGITAIMLYNSEIYLGMEWDPNNAASATVTFKY